MSIYDFEALEVKARAWHNKKIKTNFNLTKTKIAQKSSKQGVALELILWWIFITTWWVTGALVFFGTLSSEEIFSQLKYAAVTSNFLASTFLFIVSFIAHKGVSTWLKLKRLALLESTAVEKRQYIIDYLNDQKQQSRSELLGEESELKKSEAEVAASLAEALELRGELRALYPDGIIPEHLAATSEMINQTVTELKAEQSRLALVRQEIQNGLTEWEATISGILGSLDERELVRRAKKLRDDSPKVVARAEEAIAKTLDLLCDKCLQLQHTVTAQLENVQLQVANEAADTGNARRDLELIERGTATIVNSARTQKTAQGT